MDWGERYRIEHTPWDLGRAHPTLEARIASGVLAPRYAETGSKPAGERGDASPPRALVPGCGRAHDALALARAGWRVTAADLVEHLRPIVEPQLAPLGGAFVSGDVLAMEFDEPYDLVWEHTFFCAIDPGQRADYGALMARAIAPGGRLAALLFPLDRPDERGGPPWRIDEALFEAALGDAFEREVLEPAVGRTGGREWLERLAIYRRV